MLGAGTVHGVSLGVGVGVTVGIAEGTSVGNWVGVSLGTGVDEFVSVAVGGRVTDGVHVAEAVAVQVEVGVAEGTVVDSASRTASNPPWTSCVAPSPAVITLTGSLAVTTSGARPWDADVGLTSPASAASAQVIDANSSPMRSKPFPCWERAMAGSRELQRLGGHDRGMPRRFDAEDGASSERRTRLAIRTSTFMPWSLAGLLSASNSYGRHDP